MLTVHITNPHGDTCDTTVDTSDPEAEKTVLDLLPEGPKGSILSGQCELQLLELDGTWRTIREDYDLPKEGEISIRAVRLTLPEYWAGQEKYENVQDRNILIYLTHSEAYRLESVMMAAGWRACEAGGRLPRNDWLDGKRQTEEGRAFLDKGTVILYDERNSALAQQAAECFTGFPCHTLQLTGQQVARLETLKEAEVQIVCQEVIDQLVELVAG